MSVSVIIVNLNSGALLGKCLSHLRAQTVLPERVFVVDNASTDGSDRIEDATGRVTVIRLAENIGFAAANNHAIALCTTPLVALLNPDAFPEPDWLERLLSAAKEYPQYSFFGSRLISAGNPERLDGDGDCYHVSGMVWRDRHGRRTRQRDQPWEVFSPCAAAALYRREALIAVGGFDEAFFCYVEDVDLGFRLRLAGHRCMHIPHAIAYHVGSATTGGQHSEFAVYHGHRNLVWAFVKNMPGILFLLLMPLHVGLNVGSILWFSMQGKGRVIMKAKKDALLGLPLMWQKRRYIQASRAVSDYAIWRSLDKRIPPLVN